MDLRSCIRSRPVGTYYVAVFTVSWGAGALVLLPKLLRREIIRALDAHLLFPVLVLGAALTGIVLTAVVDGRSGIKSLISRAVRWRVGVQWYAAALLIPPCLITAILLSLCAISSAEFTPNSFWLGILFGLFPGFFEELGWMGFAFPRMKSNQSALTASIFLGVLSVALAGGKLFRSGSPA